MGEFNLINELQRVMSQPSQSYEQSMQSMGNMETDRLKNAQVEALFQELLQFKNAKDSGKIPKDYAPSQEILQQLHKEVAPNLSDQEFAKVAETFKVGIGGNNTPQSAPDAQQPIQSQGQASGDTVPSGSNLGDILVATLASMGRAPSTFDIGGQMADAIKSKQLMGLKKQEMAADSNDRMMALQARAQERADAAAQRKAEQDALIEQKTLDRESRVQTAKDMIAQREADRAQRAQDAADRRALSKQFHDESIQLRKDMMDLSKTKMSRIPPAKAQEVGSKIQGIQRYAELGLSFNDKYAGSIVGGPTVTAISERFGKNKDRVNWWKNFKMLDVKLRNDLFGATLTNNEQKSWDSVTVSENSDPSFVKKAMATRAKIAQDALNRELESYSDAGYDVNRLKGSANRPLPKF